MKQKNAVVVGCEWKSVCGSFAAMMVRGLRGAAEVFPVKPEALTDWLEHEGSRFKNIYIIKTYFAGDPKRTAEVLKKLKRGGVAVEIAAHPVGMKIGRLEKVMIESGKLDSASVEEGRKCGELTRELAAKGLIKFFTDDGGDLDLEDEIARRFHISTEGLSNIGDMPVCGTYYVSNVSAVELIDVGMWYAESYDSNDIFDEVVHVLADNEDKSRWSKILTSAIDHYRRYRQRGLLGKSQAMQLLRVEVRKLMKHPNARVMILGETGTGKETVAMQLHYGSARKQENFVAFNCATTNENLVESRLFGYEKGAYTDAYKTTPGIFEVADKGTVFLDEIGEMSLAVQGILLRTLENGTIQRVGGTEEIPVDVRLITATNRNLVEMVREGKFRADLYHRLNAIQIRIPPLREHKEDIADIVAAWNAQRQSPNGVYLEPPGESQIAALQDYSYPGNVRELLNILERAAIMDETDFVKLMHDYCEMNAGLEGTIHINDVNMPEDLEGATRYHVRKIFDKYDQNITKTAEVLKVSRNTARKWLS